MNVNDNLHNLQQVLGVTETGAVTEAQRSQQHAAGTAESVQDRTEVSTAASLANQAMAVPDVRMERVAAVQQAIASGSYQVSAGALADTLINYMSGK